MNKFISYLIRFGLISAIPVLLEIYVKGSELFFSNIIQSVLTIVIYYFLACLIFNIITSTCFYGLGKLNGLTISFLNFYPMYIRYNSFSISYNILSVFKLPNTYELNIENIKEYRQKVDKLQKIQSMFMIVVATLLLIIGVYFKASVFNFVFAIICLSFIVNDYFDSSPYFTFKKNNSMVFNELVFSMKIDKSILEHHIDYLQENEEELLSNPDFLYSLIKLTFSCYNLNYDNSRCIVKLDDIIHKLLTGPLEAIDMSCGGLIFDYIDNRICLDLMTERATGDMKKLLDMYISKNWDINIPQPYLNRYKVFK